MINKYVWENYLKAGGSKIVQMFRKNLAECYSDDYAHQVRQMAANYCPMEGVLDNLEEELLHAFITPDKLEKNENNSYKSERTDNCNILFDAIDHVLSDDFKYISETIETTSEQNIFEFFIDNISSYTTANFMDYPEIFVPYYYQYNFNVLQMIADEFEIVLPKFPQKKDYKGRFFYYGEICKALTAFRIKNDLDPYEMCAFLYDFAPNYIGGVRSYIIQDLPEPKGAYFIGGAKDDIYLSYNPKTITVWQCNEDTRAGDMIVMYLRSPVSAIDSVWRACSVGFIDPFFYYYRCTYISSPRKIEPVSQKRLMADEIIGKMSVVRKNMQGINGVELLPSEYNHLMDMAGADVFRFEHADFLQDDEYAREKDVENHLIKPLLAKLGYDSEDYVQQMYIEVGNHNHMLIPDFAILPQTTKGHSSAFTVIEAKRSVQSQKDLDEAKKQARSYANLLKAKYSVIISKEKIWITSNEDDYSSDILNATWQELDKPDVFFNVRKAIGKPTRKQEKA